MATENPERRSPEDEDDEARALRIAARLREIVPIPPHAEADRLDGDSV